MQLDDNQLAQAQRALLGTDSDDLIDLIFRLNLGMLVKDVPKTATRHAEDLGWIVPRSGALTPIGELVADPIREYRFWLDRGRRIHGEEHHQLLKSVSYSGKAVLEPGSGFGCNLLTLMPFASRVVGLEPIALYRQFTGIFCMREGLAIPDVRDGRAEAMPFADGEFDVVLCYSAHQYMDIRVALREMARVLRPGGQVQISGGALDAYMAEIWRHIRTRGIRQLRSHLLTIANTIAYQRTGRRLMVPPGHTSTTAPIYPRARFMDRWLNEAGLRVRADLRCRMGGETLFVADKP